MLTENCGGGGQSYFFSPMFGPSSICVEIDFAIFFTSEAKKQIDLESCKRRNLLPKPKQKGVATKASSEDSSNS